MTKEIPLTQGFVALVDDADYDRVIAAGKWSAFVRKHTTYGKRKIRVGGQRQGVLMHTYITGWPLVDHIDGNGLDNRRANLRPATSSENSQNRRMRSDNTSGLKGVSLIRGRWRARIYLDGAQCHLGYFPTPEEAALAYDAAAIKHFGEFARLNFPEAVTA